MPANRTPVHHRYLLSRLQAEWERLAVSPRALARARAWQIVDGALDTLDDVLQRAGMGGQHARAVDEAVFGDQVLGSLVRLAAGDDLAGRIVLQRLLPGLSGVARRHGACMREHLDAFDELLSAAWSVIRSYPTERRGHHFAANLLRDCEYVAFRRSERRLLVHQYLESRWLDRPVEEHEVSEEPMIELLEVIRSACRPGVCRPALIGRDVTMLRMLLKGATLIEVAAELEVSERTVRTHRDALLHRLRAAAAVAA